MQVVALRRPDFKARSFRSHLSTLIHNAGKSEFQSALARAGREALGCEHVTAFAFGAGFSPRVLNVTGISNESAAQRAAMRYSQHHWRLDPTNIFRYRPLDDEHHYVAFLSAHEVSDSQYRQDCYTLTGISHRMSVIKRQQGEFIKLSFHRARRAGPFQPGELGDLMDHVDLLIELVSRHAMNMPGCVPSQNIAEQYIGPLEALEAGLTAREVEVCAAVVAGLNSAQIGSTLGVSVNTVRTLRRRAYARLSISSQNELLRLILH